MKCDLKVIKGHNNVTALVSFLFKSNLIKTLYEYYHHKNKLN